MRIGIVAIKLEPVIGEGGFFLIAGDVKQLLRMVLGKAQNIEPIVVARFTPLPTDSITGWR